MKTRSKLINSFISLHSIIFMSILYSIVSDQDTSDLSGIFPIAMRMNNGNIFLLNNYGAFVTNITFSKIIYRNSFDDIYNSNYLLQIKINQYKEEEGGYILVYYNSKIFFFHQKVN